MANANPYQGRQAIRRAHKPLSAADVLRVLTTAIREAERLLLEAEEPEFTLKCVHALSQACGQYVRLLAEGELEARLAAVEQLVRGEAA